MESNIMESGVNPENKLESKLESKLENKTSLMQSTMLVIVVVILIVIVFYYSYTCFYSNQYLVNNPETDECTENFDIDSEIASLISMQKKYLMRNK